MKSMMVHCNDFTGKIIKTGSQVYGVYTPKSDKDFVVGKKEAKFLKDFFNLLGVKIWHVTNTVSYEGFYVQLGLQKINIVVVQNNQEFNAWIYATSKMSKIDPIKDKKVRIKTFQKFWNAKLKGEV